MISLCLEDADIILYLHFKNLLVQLIYMTRRSVKRKESLSSYIDFCLVNIQKRFNIGKKNKGKLSLKEIVFKYPEKVTELTSWKSIEELKNV